MPAFLPVICHQFSFYLVLLLTYTSYTHNTHFPQAFSHEVTAKQPEYDKVLADGQNLLQLAHPKAVAVLQSKQHQLERKWVDLRGRVGE